MTTEIGFIDVVNNDKIKQDMNDLDISCCNNTLTVEYSNQGYRIKSPISICTCVEYSVLKTINATWDTGATNSCIGEKLTRKLQLQPIDVGVAVTTTEKAEMPYYIVDVQLTAQIKIPHVKVGGVSLENHDTKFIIGMDIISKGNLSIKNNDDKTTFTFEYLGGTDK